MDNLTNEGLALTFNGPLEAGVRVVAVLGEAFPRSYDIQRLTAFDYLLVRTGQLGGPEDLHPATPIPTPATEVRRKVIQDAIHLMMTRDLITRLVQDDGIRYCAGEASAMFLDYLQTPYIAALKVRAKWLVKYLANYTDDEFDRLMRRSFDTWVIEFQHIEHSAGSEP